MAPFCALQWKKICIFAAAIVKYKQKGLIMNMPPITKNLIIINVLFFFGTIVAERYGYNLEEWLGLHFFLASDFRLYQLFTYMFMHANFEHILFNMFAVWMFGRLMENVWGPRRFLLYYVVCGVGAGLMQEGTQYVTYLIKGLQHYDAVNVGMGMAVPMADFLNRWTTVGASGAVYGILLAFGMTFPEERIFIFPLPIPIKAKFFVAGYAVIELLAALGRSGDGIAHFAHLGGMLFGLLLILHWRGPRGGSGFGGNTWGNGRNRFSDFFRQFTAPRRPRMKVYMGGKHKDDLDYNARQREKSEEIDRILQKVKRSGYGSLTEDEKRKLFDASQQ